MATDVNFYSNDLSTAGGDGTTNATSGANRAFPSVTSAITSIGSTYPNMVSSDVRAILNVSMTAIEMMSNSYTMPTITMDATRYLHIKAVANKHQGYYDTSKTGLQSPNQYDTLGNVNPWTVFENMQIVSGHATTTTPIAINITYDGSGTLRLYNNVIHCISTACVPSGIAAILWPGTGTKGVTWINNVISGRFELSAYANYGDGDMIVYDNTSVGSLGGMVLTGNNIYVRNNVIELGSGAGNATYILTPNVSLVHSNNVSSDSSSPDAAFRNKVGSYVNAAGYNYQPTNTDTVLKGQGVDLSADSRYNVTTDIVGNARNVPFDIGAFNAQASGGPTANSWRTSWVSF